MTLPFNKNAAVQLTEDQRRLSLASMNNDIDTVEALLQSGVSAKFPANDFTVVWAAANGNARVIALLAQAGADLDAKTSTGTPMEHAIRRNQPVAVYALAAAGAKVNNPNADEAPLFEAAYYGGDLTIMRVLIDFKANVNQVDGMGNTPLLTAAGKRHTAQACALLTAGANPNAVNNQGMTPLMFAVSGGDDILVEYLLRKGAQFDHPQYSKNFRSLTEYAKGWDVMDAETTEKFVRIRDMLDQAAKQSTRPATPPKP